MRIPMGPGLAGSGWHGIVTTARSPGMVCWWAWRARRGRAVPAVRGGDLRPYGNSAIWACPGVTSSCRAVQAASWPRAPANRAVRSAGSGLGVAVSRGAKQGANDGRRRAMPSYG